MWRKREVVMQKIIKKSELLGFIDKLIKKYDVVAPVKKGNTKFRKIKSSGEMYLDKVTEVPGKNFFMPEDETLVEFKNGKGFEMIEKSKKTVIFGLRKCDLNAIQILDTVMYDLQYLEKRKNSVLVGLFCDKPDEYCFCNSMELTDFYDLFFYPYKEHYYISVESKKGGALVKDLPSVKTEVRIPKPKNKKVLKKKNVEGAYRDKIWINDAKKCLSCSACTIYCPTCNCFDIKDYLDVDLNGGTRVRRQASCMLKSFSRVSGGKSFRDSRLSRFKHFVYHKIVYYKKQKGRYMCVGCGRCLRVCPTKIDWVKTINSLKTKEEKAKKKVEVKKA